MKQRDILLIAGAAALIYFVMRRQGPRGSVFVPEPERITRDVYEQETRRANVADVAKKVLDFFKTVATKRQETEPSRQTKKQVRQIRRENVRRVGELKDFC